MKIVENVSNWFERTVLFVGASILAMPAIFSILAGFMVVTSGMLFVCSYIPQIVEGDMSFKLRLLDFSLYSLVAAMVITAIGFIVGMITIHLDKYGDDDRSSYY